MIMKKIIIYIVIIIFIGCNLNNDVIILNKAKLRGKISNPKDSIVKLIDDDYKIIQEAKIDSLGAFEFNIEFSEANTYTLRHAYEGAKLYLDSGMNLYLTVDYNKFDETLTYEGFGSKINNYNTSVILQKEAIELKLDYNVDLINELDKYKDHNMLLMDSSIALLKRSFSDDNSKFVKKETSRIKYNSYTNLLSKYITLKSLRRDSTQRWKRNKSGEWEVSYLIRPDSIIIPDGYLSFMDNLDLESNDVLIHEDFIIALCDFQYWFDSELSDELNYYEIMHDEVSNMLTIINNRFKSSKARNIVIENKIDNYVSRRIGVNELKAYFEQYISTEKESSKVSEYTELYNRVKSMAIGVIAPNFEAFDTLGNRVSLGDFKDKFVYVDVWATWCSPCRKEIPFLDELQEYFSKKNIVFISVSLDADSNTWKEMVKEKSMKGVQLLAKGAFESDLAQDYLVKSIPRFLLIGPDGKIINQNASRPSQGAKDEIEKALKTI